MHNFDVEIPTLLRRFQAKKQRRRVKGTLKKIVEICVEIKITKGPKRGRPNKQQ
jgi:hypothetical protein